MVAVHRHRRHHEAVADRSPAVRPRVTDKDRIREEPGVHLTEMFAALRARGLINSVYPDRTIAAFIQAYTFGRVLAGFDSKLSKDDDAQWVALVDDAVEHILFN